LELNEDAGRDERDEGRKGIKTPAERRAAEATRGGVDLSNTSTEAKVEGDEGVELVEEGEDGDTGVASRGMGNLASTGTTLAKCISKCSFPWRPESKPD